MPDLSDEPPFVLTKKIFGVVLDQYQTVLPTEGQDGIVVGAKAVESYGQDSLCV